MAVTSSLDAAITKFSRDKEDVTVTVSPSRISPEEGAVMTLTSTPANASGIFNLLTEQGIKAELRDDEVEISGNQILDEKHFPQLSQRQQANQLLENRSLKLAVVTTDTFQAVVKTLEHRFISPRFSREIGGHHNPALRNAVRTAIQAVEEPTHTRIKTTEGSYKGRYQ